VGGGLGKITAALTWRLHRLADWLLLPRRFCCTLSIFKYLLLFNLFFIKNNKYLKMNRVFLFFFPFREDVVVTLDSRLVVFLVRGSRRWNERSRVIRRKALGFWTGRGRC
jgi:hypothetical protein